MTGRASQQAGDRFEKAVIASCEYYMSTGQLAWWSHPGPKMRFYGRRRGTAKAVGVAPPDFLFVLGAYYMPYHRGARQGQFGMLEAKATKNLERLMLAKRMHQYEQLRRARERIGIGMFGYLVDWYEVGEVRFYPVQEVEQVSHEPPKVNIVRSRGIIVPTQASSRGGAPDWLGALLEI